MREGAVGARRVLGGVLVGAALSVAACTSDAPDPPAPDPSTPVPEQSPSEDAAADAGGSDGGPPTKPDVDLPEEWERVVVEDPQTGPFEVAAPPDTGVWSVGGSLEPLAEVAAGTDWWAFWEPRLTAVEPETSNVRAMLAIPQDGTIRSVQVNVAPYDLDVEPGDAAAIADALATVARAQGNEVVAVETVEHEGLEVVEVGQLELRIDPAVLGRDVWQRFVPAPSENALWSVQCDGPTGAELEAWCTRILGTFRPPD